MNQGWLALFVVLGACGSVREICDDGLDNNDNGLVDCEERVCSQFPHCLEDCTNEIDDDADELTDCDDPVCAEDPACVVDTSDTSDTSDTAIDPG
jgi:hypothetical protein